MRGGVRCGELMDITELFISAYADGIWKDSELQGFVSDIEKHFSIEFDKSAGEEWIRLYYNSRLFGMLHTKVKIAFCTSLNSEIDLSNRISVIKASSFEDAVYSIDIETISNKCPELHWHAVKEAVDPCHFSLKELYYATV